MKDKRCGCFSNASECPENDCEDCPAKLKSEAEIRAEAIEEFAEACKNHIFCQTFGLHPKTIDEIAKELKGE